VKLEVDVVDSSIFMVEKEPVASDFISQKMKLLKNWGTV